MLWDSARPFAPEARSVLIYLGAQPVQTELHCHSLPFLFIPHLSVELTSSPLGPSGPCTCEYYGSCLHTGFPGTQGLDLIHFRAWHKENSQSV